MGTFTFNAEEMVNFVLTVKAIAKLQHGKANREGITFAVQLMYSRTDMMKEFYKSVDKTLDNA